MSLRSDLGSRVLRRAALILLVFETSVASALTMDPDPVQWSLANDNSAELRLNSADSGSGELIFRFLECCVGGSLFLDLVFDTPVLSASAGPVDIFGTQITLFLRKITGQSEYRYRLRFQAIFRNEQTWTGDI